MALDREFNNSVYRAIAAVEAAECDLLGVKNRLRIGNGLPEEHEAYIILCDALNKIRNISFDKYFKAVK